MSNHRSKVAESEERWKRHKGLEKLRANTERIENTLLQAERDELLEALKAVEHLYGPDGDFPRNAVRVWDNARALIARIEARSVKINVP